MITKAICEVCKKELGLIYSEHGCCEPVFRCIECAPKIEVGYHE